MSKNNRDNFDLAMFFIGMIAAIGAGALYEHGWRMEYVAGAAWLSFFFGSLGLATLIIDYTSKRVEILLRYRE